LASGFGFGRHQQFSERRARHAQAWGAVAQILQEGGPFGRAEVMSGLPDMRGRAAARGDPVGGRPAGIAGASHAQLAGAEHELLVRCRRYDVLQRLGAAASTRASKFQGEISTIVNNIHVRMADAFFLTLQGRDTEELRARHSATTEMLELLRELCGQIEVLKQPAAPAPEKALTCP